MAKRLSPQAEVESTRGVSDARAVSPSRARTTRHSGLASLAGTWRIAGFYVRQFATVGYFVNLMVFATVATTLVQALAYRAWGGQADMLIVRCGIIGMWSTAICAAGLVGFERYRGTLVHLINCCDRPLIPLALLVSSGATFGLAAFPLAWVTWIVVAGPAGTGSAAFPLQLAAAAALSWIAAAPMTWVIAATFVLTPNAIQYEQLLVTPFFILSGILFLARPAPAWMSPLQWASPLGGAVRLIFGRGGRGLALAHAQPGFIVLVVCVWAIWALVAWAIARWCLRRAIADGSLDII